MSRQFAQPLQSPAKWGGGSGGMESGGGGAWARPQAAHLYDTRLQLRLQNDAEPCEHDKHARKGAPKYAAECHASAYVLSSYSPFFAAALSEEWGGQTRRLEISADPKSFGHLLDFMHSMGKAMPEGLLENARLLATAHEFGVEDCIKAAVDKMAPQVGQLSWEQADKVLGIISGAACGGAEAADGLASLQQALARPLLSMLGNLDAVMNDPRRLERFCQLSLGSVEALLASDQLNVDCEETAFCAFAHWVDSYRAGGVGKELSPLERAAAAARVLPHLRFAAMRPASVVNYHYAFEWFRAYDADKEVILEALVHIADPALAVVHSGCSTTGTPGKNVRPLCRASCQPQQELEFVAEIACHESHDGLCKAAARYWSGYWWTACVDASPVLTPLHEEKAGESGVGVFVKMSLPPGACKSATGLVGKRAVGPVMALKVAIGHSLPYSPESGKVYFDREHKSGEQIMFRPLKHTNGSSLAADKWGWTHWDFKLAMSDGSPIRWNNFKRSGSPVVRGSKMVLKVALAQQAAASGFLAAS